MRSKVSKSKQSVGKRGPEAERVKLHDHWHMAVKKALKKPTPAGGWPKKPKK